ncbi:hypothetical protein HWV62_11998 [Athelia sp. TMB]|nr:hypothetical protein HWV62_11998 [Athelia sp. TMB]
MSSTLSATRKRFSFFGGSTVSKPEKTKSRRSTSDKKSTKIGEMGEIMQEEDEQPKTAAAGVTATDVAAGAAATIVGAAAAVVGAVAVVIGSPQHEHRDPIQDTVTVPVESVAGEHTATADAAVPEPDAAGTQTAIDTATTAGADAHELTSAVVPAAVLEQSADAAVPELTHTMIAKDVDVLEPAVAEEQSQVADTSVAKGADVDFAVAVSPAAAIEPLQKQEAVDTATAKDIDSSELTAAAPAAEVEEHAEPSTEQDAADTFQKFTSEREEVSVAPETVLASGETPGPQQILDASEPVPAEVHQVQESFVHDVNAPGPETAMDTEPATIEPLKDQEEANQAAATPEEHSHDAPEAEPVVELPAVPIVSTSVEDVAPAAEVDTTEPAPATEAEPTHETPVDTDE